MLLQGFMTFISWYQSRYKPGMLIGRAPVWAGLGQAKIWAGLGAGSSNMNQAGPGARSNSKHLLCLNNLK